MTFVAPLFANMSQIPTVNSIHALSPFISYMPLEEYIIISYMPLSEYTISRICPSRNILYLVYAPLGIYYISYMPLSEYTIISHMPLQCRKRGD